MRRGTFGLVAVPLGLAVFGCSGEQTLPGPQAGPVTMAMVLGDEQAGTVGQPLGLPFMVHVTDARGAGVGGVPVSWSVTSGDGALDDVWKDCSPLNDLLGDPLTADTVSTDDNGFSWVSFVPAWFGPSTVLAEVEGLEGSPVTLTADATDTAATLAMEYPFVPGDTVEIIAGQLRNLDLPVTVTDGLGQGAAGVPVTWEVTAGAGQFRWVYNTCSREDVSPTTMITRTGRGGSVTVMFRPTVFGVTTVTAAVVGVQDSPATFTFDATLFEIGLGYDGYSGTYFFGPDGTAEATVPVGAPVEWFNSNSSARITSTSVPAGGSAFDSGTLGSGDRFRFIPAVAGTWQYVDQVSGATGSLTVEGR